MTQSEIRARMDQLTGQLLKSAGSREPFEKREPLWMEREELRDQLHHLKHTFPLEVA